ncbi:MULTISPECIES: thiamine phosphate synthase [unclassified Paenibacillus]|uniref:thiamine phosphate synthase n=1 Tax=unclassified Paenibacillus TaxID=185978 RepID=UPI001AE576C2|nr:MULTISPECIES: thiamine phosphate synthase [unclassified Paenibacillus]MBP1154689.1 thiamine-phosphate diphosphorylase [Paenibacillus sp. PvP091]
MIKRMHALHVITTGRQELEEVAAILIQCPVTLIDVLHIREKQRSAQELVQWHARLKPLLTQTAVILNDRMDAALAASAEGVQLTAASLNAAQARAIAPQGMRIGCSVHSADEATEASLQGANYVIFGHVYPTSSKPGLAPRGIAALRQTVDAANVPVIAIGGIEPNSVDEVLSTGAAGVAILSSVLLHSDPVGQVYAYREALDRTKHKPRRDFT